MGFEIGSGTPHLPEVSITLLEPGEAEEMIKGSKMSENSVRKLSEAAKKRWEDPEYRKKCSDSHKGKKVSPESIAKRIKTVTGRVTPPETRLKISQSLKGKKHPISRIEHNRSAQKICKNTPEARMKQAEMASKRHGPSSGNWKGGTSFEPYCPKFTKEFKERVRAFFGHKCVECGTPQTGIKLPVHHVNFQKDSCCAPDVIPLFVPLCPSCHGKTNHNRPYWQEHFTKIINEKYGGKCYLPKGGPE
jgi:hypothetical protein